MSRMNPPRPEAMPGMLPEVHGAFVRYTEAVVDLARVALNGTEQLPYLPAEIPRSEALTRGRLTGCGELRLPRRIGRGVQRVHAEIWQLDDNNESKSAHVAHVTYDIGTVVAVLYQRPKRSAFSYAEATTGFTGNREFFPRDSMPTVLYDAIRFGKPAPKERHGKRTMGERARSIFYGGWAVWTTIQNK